MFGMGANIAIFSMVHAVLLRPLPVSHPEQLCCCAKRNITHGIETSAASLPNYLSWKQQARSLELAAFSGQTLTWTGAEYPERLEALAATESFLSVLAALASPWPLVHRRRRPARPAPGRGAEQPVVARTVRCGSSRRWTPAILNGSPYSIIGVASARILGAVRTGPVGAAGRRPSARRGNRYLSVIGRLKPGFTRDQAQADMSTIGAGLAQAFPDSNRDYGVSVTPFARLAGLRRDSDGTCRRCSRRRRWCC